VLHHFYLGDVMLYMFVPAEDTNSGVDLDRKKMLFNSLFHLVAAITFVTSVDLKQCFIDDMYAMVYFLTKLH
jgi:hypothetical protein